MKISFQKNNTNFTSRPAGYASLIDINGKPFQAFYSFLDPSDETDQQAVENIFVEWDADCDEKNHLCTDFKRAYHKNPPNPEIYNCVELIEGESLSERIIGLTEIAISKNKNCHLNYIATKPELQYNSEINKRLYNGVGANMLGWNIKFAQENNAPFFTFNSLCDAFYFKICEKAGINIFEEERYKPNRNPEFSFPNKDFNIFLKYFEDTYGTNFLKQIKRGIII